MKIVFLAPANNYHTKKWCNWFQGRGHEVFVISLVPPDNELTDNVFYLATDTKPHDNDIRKLKYITHIIEIRKIISQLKPDIVNAHYATSYGTLAVLAGVDNLIVSAWGSDIYDFPCKSVFHKLLLKFVLKKAMYIFSTSNAMADEMKKYTEKNIFITPFGVNMDLFNPKKRHRNDNVFVIGIVKTLTPKYGIETLLKAVSLLKHKYSDIPIELRIAGKGDYEEYYKKIAKKLKIDDCTTWLGFISQESAAEEWANFDCAVIPSESESESFGVSAVEAQASGCPVIISDIPGLMEATSPNITSCVFPRGNVELLCHELYNMYLNTKRRTTMGSNGRDFVQKNYELNDCFTKIENKFYEIAKQVNSRNAKN